MLGAGIKEEFDQYIHNAELSAFIADKPPQHYNLTHSFTQSFAYQPRTSRVLFHLYDNSYNISLEEFCDACKIPYWGSLDEPPRSNYELFLTSLCNGEDRGITQARIVSIQFPAIRYFALFNGKCIVGKQDCSTLCTPDLSLIHTALTGVKLYNLGAIVARRLQLNAGSGDLYGRIYASRLAARLGVSPKFNDPILPYKYLNFEAMREHRFLKRNARGYEYNLVFNKYHSLYVALPALALFDFQNKQRHFLHESEVHEYNAAVEAARQAEEAAQNPSTSYHFNHYLG
jgi:hypothetical protein